MQGESFPKGHLTVEQIRQELGTKAEGRTDAELELVRQFAHGMARLIVDSFIATDRNAPDSEAVEFPKYPSRAAEGQDAR